MIRSTLPALGVLLAASLCGPQVSNAPGDRSEETIFFAVLEGCYEDGVSNDVVDVLTQIDKATNWPVNFVYSCPLCSPALNALRTYRKRPEFYGEKVPRNTFGRGLPADVAARLTGPDAKARLDAWSQLMESWVERRLGRMRLTPKEQEAWSFALADMRKRGTVLLREYKGSDKGSLYEAMKGCPTCDGAAEACPLK